MDRLVLVAFLVQAAVGASLALRWWRRGRAGPPTVVAHVMGSAVGLASWTAFVLTSNLAPAWLAVAAITFGNTYGDKILLARVHNRTGTTSKRVNYPAVLSDIFHGKLPGRVSFHALFAGVVYFSCLGVSIAATLAKF